MHKNFKKWTIVLVLAVLCLTCLFAVACDKGDDDKNTNNNSGNTQTPSKIKDGISIELKVDESKTITVAEYINSNGTEVTVSSSNNKVSAQLKDGIITVKGIAEGSAEISAVCGEISVRFNVTVSVYYTVTVDGEEISVKKGTQYTLPQAPQVADPDKQFVGWVVNGDQDNLKQPNEKIDVNANVSVVAKIDNKAPEDLHNANLAVSVEVGATNDVDIADYIAAHGAEVTAQSADTDKVTVAVKDGKVAISGVAKTTESVDVTISCGQVNVVLKVSVTAKSYSVTVDGKVVANVDEGGSYTLPAGPSVETDMEFAGWIVNGDEENLRAQGYVIENITANVTVVAKIQRMAPVSVKENDSRELFFDEAGRKVAVLNVATYITTHGNNVVVTSSDEEEAVITVATSGDEITVTAVAKGTATITIKCGTVQSEIVVTVKSANEAPVFANGTINIDLFTQTSGEYTFATTSVPDGVSYTYVYALDGTNEKVSIDQTNGKLTYTAGNTTENVTLTINVEATVVGTTDKVNTSFTVAVTVVDTTPADPSFEDQELSYDKYEHADGIALEAGVLKAEDENYTYTYSVGGNAIDATHKFEESATVSVKGTYKANTSKDITVTFQVTVTATDTTPALKEKAIEAADAVDIHDNPTVDLAANINNANHIESYVVKIGENTLENVVNGTIFTLPTATGYSEVAQEVTYTIVATDTNGASYTYTYKVDVADTSSYRVENGSFEKGIVGWTMTAGMGNISEETDYFNGILHQKDGQKFFYGIEDKGEGTFTLQSSTFTVGGSGWITFQLGAAKHFDDQYVEIVKASDNTTVVAKIVNIMFADNGGFNADPDKGNANKLSGLTLVKYKVDLSSVMGERVYVRITDKWATKDFGMVLFDNLVSYIPDASTIAEGYTDATTARFENVTAEIDLKDTNQATVVPSVIFVGVASLEYTYVGTVVEESGLSASGLVLTATKSGSYTVNYVVKRGEAQVATFAVSVTVSNTTQLPTLDDISESYESDEWNTTDAKEITLHADGERFAYSYAVKSGSAGSIEGKKLSYTATEPGTVEIVVVATLSDKNYTVDDVMTVEFTVTLVFKDNAITLPKETPDVEIYDVYTLTEKDSLTIDFAAEKYITVPATKVASTTYSATLKVDDGEAGAITLADGSKYTISLASLTDVRKVHVFVVTATCGEETVSYTLTVKVYNSTAYRMENGGFEDGIAGWTVVGAIGAVSDVANYWVGDEHSLDGYPFHKDGNNMFSGYAPGAQETAVGTLTSPTFTIPTNRTITYKLGAAKHDVYVDVVNASTGAIIARYSRVAWVKEIDDDVKANSNALVGYVAVLPEGSEGTLAYIRIIDNATGDYGLFFCDSFVTYYDEVPTGLVSAVAVANAPASIYVVENGGFETGNTNGWLVSAGMGGVSNAVDYWDGISHQKEGTYFFLGAENKGDGVRTLQSTPFVVGGSGYITFQLGAAGHFVDQYVEIVDVATGKVLAKYYNTSYVDAGGFNVEPEKESVNKLSAQTLVKYKANLSAFIGKTVVVRVTDKWAAGEIGWVQFDNLVTCHADASAIDEAYSLIADQLYTIYNGGFETGNLNGWKLNNTTFEKDGVTHCGEMGVVSNKDAYFNSMEYNKEGDYLFTGIESAGEGGSATAKELYRGELISGTFIVKEGATLSFLFGGGAGNSELHVDLVKADGTVVASYTSTAVSKAEGVMVQQSHQLTTITEDTECYIRVVDNSSNGWACLAVDDFQIIYE